MKAKKFSRKLLALFLAVLMAMSCFSGAMVASAANASANTKYHDQDLDFNSLGWPILNDEQACTALLDFVDLTPVSYTHLTLPTKLEDFFRRGS